jgi:hypothetical protein
MDKIALDPYGEGKSVFSLMTTLKPFKSKDIKEIRKTCESMLEPWKQLIEKWEMLIFTWTIGNGELILCWSGNPNDQFEWDHYKGHNNLQWAEFGFTPIPLEDYDENWIHFTYGDLKEIFETLKAVCQEQYNREAVFCLNFEPGPEFSESVFRYVWHREIINKQGGGHGNSIAFDGILHSDSRCYGAYRDGIPEGEPFSYFLGKQMNDLCRYLGAKTVNFSNGLGFGTCPWTLAGRNFNGKEFNLVDYKHESEKIINFWREYKSQAPMPVSAQGTNWPVGADIASKCVPLQRLYDEKLLNVPLGYTVSVFFNDSVGFAMASFLSRISYSGGFGLGFYLHDMWYPQKPWEDFPYDHQPYDLYAPGSVAFLNERGEIVSANGFGTGIHDENGDFRPDVAREFIPHVEKTFAEHPDKVGPLVWLYPFEEYHYSASENPDRMQKIYFYDCFTACAIDEGLPLNTVITTGNFSAALEKALLNESIIYTPFPFENYPYVKLLTNFIHKGGKVLLYGSENGGSDEIKELLNLKSSEGIEGNVELYLNSDSHFEIFHESLGSGGAITSVLKDTKDKNTDILATAKKGGMEFVYAIKRALPEWKGGQAVWLRGTLPFTIEDGENIKYSANGKYSAQLARLMLSSLGLTICEEFDGIDGKCGQIFIWRHRNAFLFTGYIPDNTVQLGFRLPQGAPVFIGNYAIIRNGKAYYHVETTLRKECRVFVNQQEGSRLSLIHSSSSTIIAFIILTACFPSWYF